MPRLKRTIIILSLILGLATIIPAPSLAQSDETMASQSGTSSIGAMPSRGMTMDQVRQYFGEPAGTLEPVGDPPISRWLYDGMTVYFEHHLVLHSVASSYISK